MMAQAVNCPADARNETGFGPIREPSDSTVRAVPFSYLREPVMNRDNVPVRSRGHIAIRQGIAENHIRHGKLTGEHVRKAAFLGLDDSPGVMTDQAAQDRIGMLHVAEVPGAVERMKASLHQFGRVADVMQPRGGFKQVGVLTQDRGKGLGSLSDSLDIPVGMPPAAA